MPITSSGLATSFITFSRPGATGGGATVTDRDGRIKWAGHNLLTNSESFDAWTVYNATVSANSGVAPNGTTTADKILEANGSSIQARYLVSSTIQAGTAYTYSVYAKAAERSYINMTVSTAVATEWVSATFDLTGVTSTQSSSSGTGYTVVGSPSITSVGGGWYRCVLTFTVGNTANHFVYVAPGISGTPTYGSFGLVTYSGTVTSGAFVWGAHLYRSDLGGMQQNPAMGAGMGSYYPTTVRNMVGYSEDFSNAAWTKSNTSITSNAVIAPNGLQTADKIVENTSNAKHGVFNAPPGLTPINNTPYTYSVYAKAGERTFLVIDAFTGTNAFTWFNLATGTVGTNASGSTAYIQSVGNGWYRCSVIRNATTGLANELFLGIYSAPSDNVSSYTGDGTSGIYLWGAQLSDSASLDTYVPQYGAAVTSAAYYAPRLDFDPVTLAARGLLVEEQRVNLLLRSQEFDNASWGKNSLVTPVPADAILAPTGTSVAETITAANATAAHYLDQSITWTAVVHTVSVYVKRGTQQFFQITTWDGTTSRYANFDILNGTPGTTNNATSTITPVGDGWYRVTLTTSTAQAAAAGNITFAFASSASSTANPSFATVGTETFHLFGAQVEAGSFATSYIPNGSAVAGATRTADVASVSTQAFPYSASAGSYVANFQAIAVAAGVNPRVVGTNHGVDAGPIFTGNSTSVGSWNGAAAISAASPNMVTSAVKAGFAHDGSGSALVAGGGAVTTSANTFPTFTTMNLGAGSSTSTTMNGWIRQVTYLPRRISNAELQSRTA